MRHSCPRVLDSISRINCTLVRYKTGPYTKNTPTAPSQYRYLVDRKYIERSLSHIRPRAKTVTVDGVAQTKIGVHYFIYRITLHGDGCLYIDDHLLLVCHHQNSSAGCIRSKRSTLHNIIPLNYSKTIVCVLLLIIFDASDLPVTLTVTYACLN